MPTNSQRKTGGPSIVEALLLLVAVAVLTAVLYRVAGRRDAEGPPGSESPAGALTPDLAAPEPDRTAEKKVAAATIPPSPESPVADEAVGRMPPLPPGLEDKDFRLPAAPGRSVASSSLLVDEADEFFEDELVLDEDAALGEESITVLDLFRDMVTDETAALGDKKELIMAMGQEDLLEALDMIGGMEWGPDAESLFTTLMARWGKLDPAGALEYAGDLESRRIKQAAVSQVLKTWARNDPRAAFAWFSGLSEQQIRDLGTGARTLFKGMAAEDALWALDQAWSLPTRSLKSQALQSALSALTSQGYEPAALVALYQGMPQGTDRALLAQTIVDQWTRYQPEAAAQWIETLTDDGSYVRVVERLVSQWSQDDPVRASAWVTDLPDPDMRRVQMGRVAQAWVRTDPGAASAWLSTFPPSTDLDPAIHGLARGVLKDDPAGAWTWAEVVTADGARNRLLQQVGREWMKQDPVNASAGIAGSSLPPNIKNKLLN